jgi:hypothetical protein
MDVIADQPQTVQAVLKPAPVATSAMVQVPEKKPRPEKKQRKERAPRSSDGVVDILDALK